MTKVIYIAVNTDNNEPLMQSESLKNLVTLVGKMNRKFNREAVKIYKKTITTEIEEVQMF